MSNVLRCCLILIFSNSTFNAITVFFFIVLLRVVLYLAKITHLRACFVFFPVRRLISSHFFITTHRRLVFRRGL